MSKQVINNQVFENSEVQKREVVNNVLIEPTPTLGGQLIGTTQKSNDKKIKSKTIKPRRKKIV